MVHIKDMLSFKTKTYSGCSEIQDFVCVFHDRGSTRCVVTQSLTYLKPKLIDFTSVKVLKELKKRTERILQTRFSKFKLILSQYSFDKRDLCKVEHSFLLIACTPYF